MSKKHHARTTTCRRKAAHHQVVHHHHGVQDGSVHRRRLFAPLMQGALLRLPLLLAAFWSTSSGTALAEWSNYEGPATGILQTVESNARPGLTLHSQPGEGLSLEELPPMPNLPGAIDLTVPTDDLWVRLRNGFAMPDLNNSLVLAHQQRYMNQSDYLRRMVERSSKYLYYIVSELERRGMPTEIALLPMVESSFNPMAHSPAQASGLWQFIPSTGRTYKLNQDWWVDERRDVVASTNAALDYLQNIYQMHGDWHLALASYNWGENAVARAVRKNEAQGLPTDFNSLTMPAETRNYVPKLQALKNIFGNAQLMARLHLPSLPNRPYFETVKQNAPIDVRTAARLAGMTLEEFIALNPSHNRAVIKGNSRLVLPTDRVGTYMSNLENHSGPLSSWKLYAPKQGERLESIAPRFGVTVADLQRANGLRTPETAGPALLVPNTEEKATGSVSEQVVAGSSAPATPRQPDERVIARTVPPPPVQALVPVRAAAPASPVRAAPVRATPSARARAPKFEQEEHTVRKGETLGALAKRYGVSVEALKKENRIKGELKAGSTLTITVPVTEKAEKNSRHAKAEQADKRQGRGRLAQRGRGDDDDEDECTGRRCKQQAKDRKDKSGKDKRQLTRAERLEVDRLERKQGKAGKLAKADRRDEKSGKADKRQRDKAETRLSNKAQGKKRG